MVEKEKVLMDVANVLNKEDQPWEVIVEGDSIIASWKWMNAVFFQPSEITEEIKQYKFTVTLGKNGKYTEHDQTENKKNNIDFSEGKISFGASTFSGQTTQKSFTIGLGKDKQTDKTGVIVSKFDTQIIKEPIRQYLKDCGWKKKVFFW